MKTFHEESDSGAVFSAIHHTPEIQRLISEGNCWDLESLTRLILVYAEEDPNGWRDWTDEVQGALLSYMYNAREDEVNRIRDEDLEVFRHSMPLEFFEQEFLCKFLDIQGGLFGSEDIEAAILAGEVVDAIQLEGDDEW